MEYTIRRARSRPGLDGDWDDAAWRHADVACVESFHSASSVHRPQTESKILYDDAGLYVAFRVRDRYVRCTRTEHQSITSKDSCVELYLQPKPGAGYLNFEMNCGGTMLLFYVTDPTRCDQGIFKGKQVVPRSLLQSVQIHHSLPKVLPVEIAEPVDWTVQYFVPNAVFEKYVGALEPPEKRRWRGNFFKCADESSHPHWASWNPIGDELNFHDPAYFADIRFETRVEVALSGVKLSSDRREELDACGEPA